MDPTLLAVGAGIALLLLAPLWPKAKGLLRKTLSEAATVAPNPPPASAPSVLVMDPIVEETPQTHAVLVLLDLRSRLRDRPKVVAAINAALVAVMGDD